MKLYSILAIGLFVLSAFAGPLHAQSTWQSNLVQLDTETGELSYTADPVSGVRIPDFSRAGYKGGGVALPTVEVKVSIEPIAGDNTAHIQDAIDAVCALPVDSNGFRGAVFLNPGIYAVHGTLKIQTSGVVLRGSGRGSDSATNTHILGLGNTPEDRSIITMGGLHNTRFKGMVAGTQTNITSPLVQVGDKKFTVANAAPFQIGDNIIIKHPCTQAWLNSIDGGQTASDPNWTVDSQPIIYNTRIENIKGNTIYTNSPVFNNLDASVSQAYIYKYDRDGLVENVGIENLLIDIEYNHNDPDDANHARTAVTITQAENAWIKESEFLHFWSAGVNIETANYVTIENVHAYAPKGPTIGGYKYNFCVSDATQNTLFTNCKATEARHAYISNGTSTVAGVVFHKSTSVDAFNPSEGHRRWTTGLLYDNFLDSGNMPSEALGLYNRGDYGTSHGWASVNSVAWNCDASRPGTDGEIVIQRPPTAQNFAIGCKGIVSGDGPFTNPTGYIEGSNRSDVLVPNSLYEAQLVSRNYVAFVETADSIDVQNACNSFTWMDGITYYSSTNVPEYTLTDPNGYDSVVRLDLTINTVDTAISQTETTITADLSGATYQWLNCTDGFSEILGATNQSFSPSTNGDYAVEILQNGCSDISICVSITSLDETTTDTSQNETAPGTSIDQTNTNTSIEESATDTLLDETATDSENDFMVYPNPTNGALKINLGATYSAMNVEIFNASTKLVLAKTYEASEMIELDISDKSAGLYYIKLTTLENTNAFIPIVKQ